ncbi:Molybdenum ABC transporter permease (fragment) [Sphingomonas aurantiaca]|uniref:Molybdenum ABC transporter permease n=1 Tax=Sphingomonas aurantiaca TaxID=185949 RepID=A0A5E7ZZK8_9SPHN
MPDEWASVENDWRLFVARTSRNVIESLDLVRFVALLLQRNSFHGRLALRKDDAHFGRC